MVPPKALANSGPGLFQPWGFKGVIHINAEGVRERFQR